LSAGIVAELHKSFHSVDGWGIRVLETIQLIHQMRSRIIFSEEEPHTPQYSGRNPNLKGEATKWLKERISIDRLLHPGNQDQSYTFSLIGFADEPNVFVHVTLDGINFSYDRIRWHGHTPVPGITTLHTLSLDKLESLTDEEKGTLAIDTLLKTKSNSARHCSLSLGSF
jgi:hypothetical protein